MKDNGISPINSDWSRPTHVVTKEAGLTQVIQHTDSYIGEGNDSRSDAQPHYRYRRYLELLQGLRASKGREANVDIGCGAGLFSWVFLDWAIAQGVGIDRVDLYGLDHNKAMVRLARGIRARLLQGIPDYPELHYCSDPELLLRKLTDNHREGTDYTITLGHVLAQAHSPSDIDTFAQVVAQVLESLDPASNCVMIAVDAQKWAVEFTTGWASLLSYLEGARIGHRELRVEKTAINDKGRAKIAELFSVE